MDDADVAIWLSLFGDLIECTDSDLLGLGVVSGSGAFLQDGQSLERTKGKSKAVDITEMFIWEGIAFDTSLDVSSPDGTYAGSGIPDGNITSEDFLSTDINGDGVVDGETQRNAPHHESECVEGDAAPAHQAHGHDDR